jgi:hypothetical protein
MVDPMDALSGFQAALDVGSVQLNRSALHPDLV